MNTPFIKAGAVVPDIRSLLLSGTTMIDVRAPIEFAHGTIPKSINIPLLNDNEREEVGICFRHAGQQSAINLGHRIVSGKSREQRIEAWCEQLKRDQNSILFCARGGMRSKIAQDWIHNAGYACSRVTGGFKAMRNCLLDTLHQFIKTGSILILGGMTGTGKTKMLNYFVRAINLEHAANHKGSSFGRSFEEQPSQLNFENCVLLHLLNLVDLNPDLPIIFENESRSIGSRQIPPTLFDKMNTSPIVIIKKSFEDRVSSLLHEYVIERHRQTLTKYPDDGDYRFRSYLKDSLHRIKKRLGGERTKKIANLIDYALVTQDSNNYLDHRAWLAAILREYYDPMYNYQLNLKRDKVAFCGDFNAVQEWIKFTISDN